MPDQFVKSIAVYKQVLRADGTAEPPEVAAYMDRDPEEMRAVLSGEKLPDGAAAAGVLTRSLVDGRITSGRLAVDLLNSVSSSDADRICEMNERKN